MSAYAKTERGREVLKQIGERMRTKYPLKEQARKLVAYALKIGYLEKPTHCSECKKEAKKLHGHHPNYEKALEVIWLCGSCHILLHNKNKKVIL